MEDLIAQLEGLLHDLLGGSFEHSLHKLLGLDKELRSIRSLLKVEMVKKVQLEECIKGERHKIVEICENPEYDNGIREDIRNRIKGLNNDLKARQESIDLLKGRLTNQITNSKRQLPKYWTKTPH